ncbi:hypothetical protein BN2476_170156 [Paraburkholderia piptadeniae]|uniref:Uncharacterized protein n=1 Tax=Paraburkholderia piptadeniae TaxID=1701573 RepID=A0A1N7RTR8_9BURK|nr:hypothetical protein BN2476_170156 [Paraburkholderia piptadeniae]
MCTEKTQGMIFSYRVRKTYK